MKYFVMSGERRANHFLKGQPNPIFTRVFPESDFAATGYWFWLKSPQAHASRFHSRRTERKRALSPGLYSLPPDHGP